MFELSKQFRFESAHTLERVIETEASRRVHGHSYRAEVTLRGAPEPKSGMIVDLGLLQQALEETRLALDHRMLDDIAGLGAPTMENLSRWIWNRLAPQFPNLAKVAVHRDSCGENCVYYGPDLSKAAE